MSNGAAFEQWATAYNQFASSGQELLWPSETLVRLFKGNYVPGLDRANLAGKQALDVGFGNGNNLVFLASLGLRLSGTEVDPRIVEAAAAKLKRIGHEADLRIGTNRSLPFEDGTFDFLVSWNVIHHEDNEADIDAAILEYRRVLAPGGRFFICTTGPDHKILLNSVRLGPHRYQIGRPDDFRAGQAYWYFEDAATITEKFGASFSDVLVGRTHDHLFTETLDWFIISGVKAGR
jgi:SAM-dependent methyltransferase